MPSWLLGCQPMSKPFRLPPRFGSPSLAHGSGPANRKLGREPINGVYLDQNKNVRFRAKSVLVFRAKSVLVRAPCHVAEGPISGISLSQFESSVGAAISGAQMIDGLSRITASGIAAG